MSRLVDESVVLGNIHNAHEWNEVRAWLKIAPTVDAVPVVRCKDCKHCINHDKRCKVWNHGIDSNGYCHKGERGDDD